MPCTLALTGSARNQTIAIFGFALRCNAKSFETAVMFLFAFGCNGKSFAIVFHFLAFAYNKNTLQLSFFLLFSIYFSIQHIWTDLKKIFYT